MKKASAFGGYSARYYRPTGDAGFTSKIMIAPCGERYPKAGDPHGADYALHSYQLRLWLLGLAGG